MPRNGADYQRLRHQAQRLGLNLSTAIPQMKRHLHLIEVNGGTHSDILAGAGCVDIWESCFIGHELYGKLGNNMARRIQSGETICED